MLQLCHCIWHMARPPCKMQVVELEMENLRLNGVAGRACILDWRDRDSAMRLGKFELILCADLLYASTLVKVLQLAPVPISEHCQCVAPCLCYAFAVPAC